MNKRFDVIILGLGAMGSASLFQLAKKGKRVLGIDQFRPPHAYGSSHGQSRVIRQAIGEGEEYVPLVLRSYELWREIEIVAGTKLLETTGGLIMARTTSAGTLHGSNNFLQQTIAAAKAFGINHSLLDTGQIRSRFPQFNLIGDEQGYYEPTMGFLIPELAVETQLGLAEQNGAEMRFHEKVVAILPHANHVTVQTSIGEYEAGQVVVSAGSWLRQLLGDGIANYFKVYRQVLFWFDVQDSIEHFLPGRFPVFIWELSDSPDDFVYGLPAIDGAGGGVKLGSEQHIVQTDPQSVDRTVSSEEVSNMYVKYVRERLPGVSDKCLSATVCLYTSTPDSGFVIDFHPEYSNVLIVSPCSGHGFKHSAAIGEIVSELVTAGVSRLNIDKFRWRGGSRHPST